MGILVGTLMCEDMVSCTDLARRHIVVLIKYAHVLICIYAGEGTWHVSAISFIKVVCKHYR